MKTEIVRSLTETFEGHAQQTDGGVEYWLARDVQHLLVYTKWENFLNVVSKAKTACEVSGHDIANHFPDVRKMVDLGSGSQSEIEDIMLTRYAGYLIAQNSDAQPCPRARRQLGYNSYRSCAAGFRRKKCVKSIAPTPKAKTRKKVVSKANYLSAPSTPDLLEDASPSKLSKPKPRVRVKPPKGDMA